MAGRTTIVIAHRLSTVREAHAIVVFFFSSRRRHTRSLRDWSSDVCSSDLCWLEQLLLRARLTSSRSRVPSSSASGLENQRRASARSLGKVAALPHPLFSSTSSTRLLLAEE